MKKTLLASVVAMGVASTGFAFDGAYVGGNLGFDTFKTDPFKDAPHTIKASGLGADLVAGFGMVTDDNLYVGGELVGGMSTANKKEKFTFLSGNYESKLSSKYHYGANARLGYVIDDATLVFVKAGIDLRHFNLIAKSNTVNIKNDKTISGWLAGVGAEYKVHDNVSVGAEYNYASYSKEKNYKEKPTAHHIKAGVKYYFN